MAKSIIQPHGRLNDWVADDKGYFHEEGLDYELNVEGSRKNTPPLASMDASGSLADNRFGAFERYAEGHGRKGKTQAILALRNVASMAVTRSKHQFGKRVPPFV